jgi:hypothetical protein
LPYPSEHSARLIAPHFDKYARKNDAGGAGVDFIFGISNGKSELQAIRFDKKKFTAEEAHAWLKAHDKHPLSFHPATSDHSGVTATGICVRGPVKNVSVMPGQSPKDEALASIHGQAGSGLGRSHEETLPRSKFEVAATSPQDKAISMPIPKIVDPKSKLTDTQIIQKQVPHKDDPSSVGRGFEEQKDLSGITYGRFANGPLPITRKDKAMAGMQRMIPSAYKESITYGSYCYVDPTVADQWKWYLGEVNNLSIFRVKGSYVREFIDPRFATGGHTAQDDYIGSKEFPEAWIDSDSPSDLASLSVHECTEYFKMTLGKQGYDDAHDIAEGIEELQRKIKHMNFKECVTLDFSEKPRALGIMVDKGQRGPQGDQLTKDATTTQTPASGIKQDMRGELQQERDKPVYKEEEDDLEGEWVEAFRAGEHTDADGVSRKWSPVDINNIAIQYNKASDPNNPERHVAPVVLGHPDDKGADPAMGWIDRAKAVGDKLYLKLTELQPAFVDALKKGMYKTRSISLYPDLNIRHLGFLGASVPAVKGLAPFKFEENKPYHTYEFGEGMEDVNEIKTENKWYKRLFSMFKIEPPKDFAQQTTEVLTIGTTHPGATPEGATMSEVKIAPPAHLKYAGEYLAKAQSHLETAITGESGTDINAGLPSEFLSLAAHHMSAAEDGLTSGNIKPEQLGEYRKHMEQAHAHMAGGNFKSAKESMAQAHLSLMNHCDKPMEHAEAPATPEEPIAHPEGLLDQVKEIPVKEVKDDKDKVTKLEEEVTALKEELAKAQKEVEKLTQEIGNKETRERNQSYREFAEKLVGEGRLRPVDVEQTVLNMKLRDDQDKQSSLNFAEGKTPVVTSYLENYKTYLSTCPRVVDFSEVAVKATAADKKPNSSAADEKIKSYMEKGQSYHVALNTLAQESPELAQQLLQDSFQ